MNIYDFEVLNKDNTKYSLSNLKGKVLLIINTATHCGFTKQYEQFQSLYEKLNDKGFEILDFPCNQFAGQAPEDDDEILKFCTLKFNIKFKQFKKIKVNGKEADPLYVYLKDEMPGTLTKAIKWNFTKFLVDKNGNVVKRYAPNVKPFEIENDILELLK